MFKNFVKTWLITFATACWLIATVVMTAYGVTENHAYMVILGLIMLVTAFAAAYTFQP